MPTVGGKKTQAKCDENKEGTKNRIPPRHFVIELQSTPLLFEIKPAGQKQRWAPYQTLSYNLPCIVHMQCQGHRCRIGYLQQIS